MLIERINDFILDFFFGLTYLKCLKFNTNNCLFSFVL